MATELEHISGYTGHHRGTLKYHPTDANYILFGVGCNVVVQDVTDPHNQVFMRGHDEEITCLCVSADGRVAASGQLGSQSSRNQSAPVIVWNLAERDRALDLIGLAGRVISLDISADGRFIVGTGQNQMIFVWDVTTAEAVYSRTTEQICSVALFGSQFTAAPVNARAGARPSYSIYTAMDYSVLSHELKFDLASMMFVLSTSKFSLPNTGSQRKFTCAVVHNKDYLVCGSQSGDLYVFGIASLVYRASLPAVTGGVTALASCGGGLLVGGGDGRVILLHGKDALWEVKAENVLLPSLSSISISPSLTDGVIGTSAGQIYRFALDSRLTAALLTSCPGSPVADLAVHASNPSRVVAALSSGGVSAWSLDDLTMTLALPPAKPRADLVCLCFLSEHDVVVGSSDGIVRVMSLEGDGCSWQVQAHRGAVRSVAVSGNLILTGGEDGCLRIFKISSKELLGQFAEHKKPITTVIPDCMHLHLIHSVGEDRQVITYDLQKNKPVARHLSSTSNIYGVTQRRDHEQELITCHADGRLLFWDIDYADSVAFLQATSPTTGLAPRLLSVKLSPSGRFVASGGGDGLLYLFDLKDGQQLLQVSGHSGGPVSALSWTPDEKQLVTGSADKSLGIWNFFGPDQN